MRPKWQTQSDKFNIAGNNKMNSLKGNEMKLNKKKKWKWNEVDDSKKNWEKCAIWRRRGKRSYPRPLQFFEDSVCIEKWKEKRKKKNNRKKFDHKN